jgi:hypothetical protein
LTDRAGYQDNPLLILVKANAAITEYRMKSGPGYDVNVLTLIAEAVRKAGLNFNFGSDKSPSAVTRREAAFVNLHASSLYRELGNHQEAKEREWVERFYGMTIEERETFDEGDMIEIIPPGVTVMEAPSSSELKLDNLEREWKENKELQAKLDQIGSQIVPTDHRAGELYQSPNDAYQLPKYRQEKGRIHQSGKSLRYKVVMVNANPYSKANVYSDGYGAIFELPLKIAKAGNTLRRLERV